MMVVYTLQFVLSLILTMVAGYIALTFHSQKMSRRRTRYSSFICVALCLVALSMSANQMVRQHAENLEAANKPHSTTSLGRRSEKSAQTLITDERKVGSH